MSCLAYINTGFSVKFDHFSETTLPNYTNLGWNGALSKLCLANLPSIKDG